MKLERLKTEKQLRTRNDKLYHIQSYGELNDYPQKLMEVVGASITGGTCVSQYARFCFGRGFRQREFFNAIVNDRGERADDVLASAAEDLARFGGFALHVNWNALYEITSVACVPFEWLRFQELDDNYQFSKIALHPDWGRRYTMLRRWQSKDIVWFDFFNPDPEAIREQVEKAGGWQNWTGQIFYYSNRGPKAYPLPMYDSALTDMSAEEGLSNLSYRNIRNNYFPAGMFIDHNNPTNGKEQADERKKELSEFQGDTKAGKMLYVNLEEGEQAPEFKPFESQNTDKKFTESTENVPDRIGAAFCQPPILRAKDVGSNFGATAMKEAYEYYNSQTETERLTLERVMRDVFSHFRAIQTINPDDDYSILPKVYEVNQTLAERLGENTEKVTELLFDDTKSEEAKRVVLAKIYGMDSEDIEELLTGIRS